MSLLAFLVAWMGLKTFSASLSPKIDGAFVNFWQHPRIQKMGVFAVFAPVIVLAIFSPWIYTYDWVFFGVSVVVLLLTLQVFPFESKNERIMDAWYRSDYEGMAIKAEQAYQAQVPEKPFVFSQWWIQSASWTLLHTWVGVLFWFAVLGPAGALLYRLSQTAVEQNRESEIEESDLLLTLFNVMNILPAHIMTLGFALMGHFAQVVCVWKSVDWLNSAQAKPLVEDACLAGLGESKREPDETVWEIESDDVEALPDYLNRVQWFVVALLAIVVFVGVVR